MLVKTQTGLQMMKDRSVTLGPRQRSAFILFDGRRTLEEVLVATAGTGVTRESIEQLVAQGLLAELASGGQADAGHEATVPMPLETLPGLPLARQR